jgi:hypothetical protein
MRIHMLQEHLAIAEVHVAIVEECLLLQNEIVGELERGGHDATLEKQMLAQYETMQALRLLERERLRAELGNVGFVTGN